MRTGVAHLEAEASILRAARAHEHLAAARDLEMDPTDRLRPPVFEDVGVAAWCRDSVVSPPDPGDAAAADVAQDGAEVWKARVGRPQVSMLDEAPVLAVGEVRMQRRAGMLAFGLENLGRMTLQAKLEPAAAALALPAVPHVAGLGVAVQVLPAAVAPRLGY